MMFGEQTANTLYIVLGIIIQILAYGSVAVIVGVGVWGVYSFWKNHGKPDKPSEELLAIRAIGDKLDKLIELIERIYGTTKIQ
jgi:hypothetical protein